MYFLIEGDDLLEKYNTTWNKVNTDIKNVFDWERVYNKRFLKSKILSTDFHDIEIHKRGSDYTSRNQCRLWSQ